MAKHYNPSLIERAAAIFNTKTGDHISPEVAQIISPVVELRTPINVVRGVTSTNTASETIFTTPATKDFYITSVSLSMSKNVTSPAALFRVRATMDLATQTLLSLRGLTLTAERGENSITYPHPGIKIDRNSNIAMEVDDVSAGTANVSAEIFGYILETRKGGQ